ncbi:hypothetical protein MKX03_033628 [Papaver bracteatum]|nr:hypothetical protein MKX03_033628 [Papaver bracteatum]
MSERNGKRGIDCTSTKLDLKLNLSVVEQLNITTTTHSSTSSNSYVSLENKRQGNDNSGNSEETTTVLSNMVLVGCPKCLLYVMLAKDNLRCPLCKTSDFVYILDYNTKNNKKARKN